MKEKIISISMALVLCCVLVACSTENITVSTVSSESTSTGFDETTSAISSESSKSSESTVTVSKNTATSAQSSKSSESTITSSEAAAPATYDEVMEQYGDVFGGLTLQQMQEDIDYLWTTMQESYPFLGLVRRKGIDAEAVYNETCEALTGIKGDYEFYNQIDRFIRQFKSIGHLNLLPNNSYFEGYRDLVKTILDEHHMKRGQILYDSLNKPVSIQSYANLEKLEEQLAALNGSGEQSENASFETLFADNPTFDILEPDRIAYMKVPIMKDTPQADHSQFIDFYTKIAGFEHLIIDITGNGGGSSLYWTQNIVEPTLSQPISAERIILIPDSQAVIEYVKSADSDMELLPISQLPELPGLEQDDLEQLAYFYINQSTYEPTGESPFSGKIWVLIDGRVYSSSEAFALFCKSTGFATLVGTPSRGDSGIDPQLFVLPNSGLVVRFHTIYPINADGACNTEHGTVPDFVSPDGETPLETCLKLIESE